MLPRSQIPILHAALTTWLAALSAGLGAATPDPPPIRYGPGRQLCELANVEIDESSGLACGRRNPALFWTHNDSGDGPRLFAVDRKGENPAICYLKGAKARDWEDMASFQLDGQSYLLIGDVGDNGLSREHVTLYLVREPAVKPSEEPVELELKVHRAIRFTYEDGPRNCEAIGVDTARKLVLLVTKELRLSCKVYVLPLHAGKDPVARRIATLKIPMVTAMDVSPDGRRAVVLTYAHACEFVRKGDEPWAEAFRRAPRVIAMPPRIQGESICYGPDGKTLYLTSEKTPTPLIEVPVAAGK